MNNFSNKSHICRFIETLLIFKKPCKLQEFLIRFPVAEISTTFLKENNGITLYIIIRENMYMLVRLYTCNKINKYSVMCIFQVFICKGNTKIHTNACIFSDISLVIRYICKVDGLLYQVTLSSSYTTGGYLRVRMTGCLTCVLLVSTPRWMLVFELKDWLEPTAAQYPYPVQINAPLSPIKRPYSQIPTLPSVLTYHLRKMYEKYIRSVWWNKISTSSWRNKQVASFSCKMITFWNKSS